jgi:hypothetical protein
MFDDVAGLLAYSVVYHLPIPPLAEQWFED